MTTKERRREMPRSLAACVSEVVEMLTEIGGVTGRQAGIAWLS